MLCSLKAELERLIAEDHRIGAAARAMGID